MRLIHHQNQNGLPPRLTTLSEAWLLGRAHELVAKVPHTSRPEQLTIISALDELLTEAQNRGNPTTVAVLLRAAGLARLTAENPAKSERILDELLAHSRHYGLSPHQADAHALRGHALVLAGQEDAALTEIARALATLDDNTGSQARFNHRDWNRMRSTAFVDCWRVLNELGIFEAAEEMIIRAHQVIQETASPHEITTQLINRVKMLLGWALRLERVGQLPEAAEKFQVAASMAVAVEAPFTESLFPRKPNVPATAQVGVLAAALAFAQPHGQHVACLRRLAAENSDPLELVLITIALARSLEQLNRREEALAALKTTQENLAGDGSQPTMKLNLIREIARLDRLPASSLIGALMTYNSALEVELWSLREAQIATLNTRRKHEQLSVEHGAISLQALQDPLTGLPNRRALDDRLHAWTSAPNAQPLAVALVDLDGFKEVNDQHSHGEGDNVLRVVASTVRDALRGNDIVARYGGDEFIVLLPGTPLTAAEQALSRAVIAVSALPAHLSHHVTLSVGLVSLKPAERPEEVLARADSAMYQAKHRGGNQVFSTDSVQISTIPEEPIWPEETPLWPE